MYLYVRDYCLGATYTPPMLTIAEPNYLIEESNFNTNSSMATLFIKKHILQPTTNFYLNYHNYTKFDNPNDSETPDIGVDCGWV